MKNYTITVNGNVYDVTVEEGTTLHGAARKAGSLAAVFFQALCGGPVSGGHPEGPGQAGRADDRPAPAGGAGAGPRF